MAQRSFLPKRSDAVQQTPESPEADQRKVLSFEDVVSAIADELDALRTVATGGTVADGLLPSTAGLLAAARKSSGGARDGQEVLTRGLVQGGVGLAEAIVAVREAWVQPSAYTQVPFIVDVTPTASGNVYDKTHEADTSPAGKVLTSCETDTDNVTVTIEVDGDDDSWQPQDTEVLPLGGSPVVIPKSSFTQLAAHVRRFTATADIVVTTSTTIQVTTSDGVVTTASITRAAAPPSISSAAFIDQGTNPDPYPDHPTSGPQSAVKQGDQLTIDGTCSPDTTEIVVKNAGASSSVQSFPGAYGGGTFSVTINVGSRSGSQTCTLFPKRGATTGSDEDTSNSVLLDQTTPTLVVTSITFPGSQEAIKSSESATVNLNATGQGASPYFNAISPNTQISITDPTTFSTAKSVTRISGGYNVPNPGSFSGPNNNLRIDFIRRENGAAATQLNATVAIAHDTPVLQIREVSSGTSPAPDTRRLRASPSGLDSNVYIISNQRMNEASPGIALTAAVGTWQGSWTKELNGSRWRRALRIQDSDIVSGGQAGNTYSWSGFSITNKAGIVVTIITTDADDDDVFKVGGFTQRTLTIPAIPERAQDIGCRVVDTTKLSAELLSKGGPGPNGGTYQTFEGSANPDFMDHDDPDPDNNNFFTIISDPNSPYSIPGDYDPDNQYYYNSDSPQANANTSGTAQVVIEELET